MEFKIAPKTVTAHRLYINIIGSTESTIKIYWELKSDDLVQPVDKGNWDLPKTAFQLFAALNINSLGHIENDEIRAAVNQILSHPRIAMVLADYEPEPEPPVEEEPTEEEITEE